MRATRAYAASEWGFGTSHGDDGLRLRRSRRNDQRHLNLTTATSDAELPVIGITSQRSQCAGHRAANEGPRTEDLTASQVSRAALKEWEEATRPPRQHTSSTEPQASSALSHYQKEISKVQKELSLERLEHEKTRNLLEAAHNEIQAGSFFFDQTDDIPYTHVIRLTKDLNFHIFELAAQISDELIDKYPIRVEDKRRSRTMHLQRKRVILDKAAEKDLFIVVDQFPWGNSKHMTLLQYTLQSWLVVFCFNLLERTRWSADALEERVLRNLYDRLIENGKDHRHFAGRWRTLTRVACKTTHPSNKILEEQILSGLRTVLASFDFHASPKAATTFLAQFRDSISTLVENLLEIDHATKHRVSTADILPFIGSPGSEFLTQFLDDGNAGSSRLGRNKAKPEDKVLLPIGLGLTIRKHRDKSNPECLLRSNVILRSQF